TSHCRTFSRDIRSLPSSLTDIQSPSLTPSCSLSVQPLLLPTFSFTLNSVCHSLPLVRVHSQCSSLGLSLMKIVLPTS
ncbi:hypothetical protein VIGAN_09098100, partial [Vigna angularis var. angularis]